MPSIGLTVYPTYPQGFFPGGMANPFTYQNGGDWTWFGGRMIQQLVVNGLVKEAYQEIRPMIFTNGTALAACPAGRRRSKARPECSAKPSGF